MFPIFKEIDRDIQANLVIVTTEISCSGLDFGEITDIEVGPYDGCMYIVSVTLGKIFKISLSDL